MTVIKTFLLAAIVSTSKVIAHGIVSSITAEGIIYNGYNAGVDELNPVGWKIPDDHNLGFIGPDAYGTPNIVCHINATPASHSVTVRAGGQIKIQWTIWPQSHHGPVIDYLANCNGPCETVDKTSLKFNKIAERGMIIDAKVAGTPGTWATDELVAAGNSWTVTVPDDIAPGEVVLRTEIIALQNAVNPGGAQNYPQCINLKVIGSGTDELTSGTPGESLYKPTDPGIDSDIYKPQGNYIIPGPPLYNGGSKPFEQNKKTETKVGKGINFNQLNKTAKMKNCRIRTRTA